MQSKQILIVDDDAEDRAILRDAMDSLFQKDILLFAENGEHALEVLSKCFKESRLPCLVVLDLNMPRKNGTETLRAIKTTTEYMSIHVIIYSTSINPIEKERCLELGAHDYITKPISFAESKATALKLLSLCEIQ